MSLAALFIDLTVRLQSTEFLQTARHAEHPTAFSRQRKLPLPTLMALMLTGMHMSILAELDVFFGHLQDRSQLVRTVPEQYSFVPGLCRLRLVGADASTMRSGLARAMSSAPRCPTKFCLACFYLAPS